MANQSVVNATVPSPGPVDTNVTAPSSFSPSPGTPSQVAPSPSETNVTAPSPFTPSPVTPSSVTPSPFTPSPVTPSPVTPSPFTPSPVTPSPVTPSPFTPSPFTPSPGPFTPSPPPNVTVPAPSYTGFSDDSLALQQFVLAVVATMLCVFLMFRNKERIMTRTFHSSRYVNIVDSGSEEPTGEGIDTKMVELPEIDDIDEIALNSDESDNTERV